MPTYTYGRPESAKDHPPTAKVSVLDGIIGGVERELTALRATRHKAVENCDCHFVPPADFLATLPETLVSGVYNAGELIGWGPRLTSKTECTFTCSKCSQERDVAVTERCPACGSELGDGVHHYDYAIFCQYYGHYGRVRDIWLVECSCGFKAAAWAIGD